MLNEIFHSTTALYYFQIYLYLISVVKPFYATGIFIYPLKTSENFFSRGMEKYRCHVTVN